jgi:hypothetical protein
MHFSWGDLYRTLVLLLTATPPPPHFPLLGGQWFQLASFEPRVSFGHRFPAIPDSATRSQLSADWFRNFWLLQPGSDCTHTHTHTQWRSEHCAWKRKCDRYGDILIFQSTVVIVRTSALKSSNSAIYSFRMILRINSDHFLKQHQPVDLCNGEVWCSLWGTDWILK